MTVAKLLIMIGLIAESAKEVSQPDNYGPRTRARRPWQIRSAWGQDSVEDYLRHFNQGEIRHRRADQVNKEQWRRCDETEPPSEWEKRKDSRSSDRPKCHGDEEGV